MHLQSLFALLSLAASTSSAPAPKFNNPAPLNLVAASDREDSTLVTRTIGGVRLADGANFTGHVWYGVYSLNDCIGLGDYTGNLLSFRPDQGTVCLVMQGKCDANAEYTQVYHNSTHIGDLSYYDFYKDLASYICMDTVSFDEAALLASMI